MKNLTLKIALSLLLGVGMASTAFAQKIGGIVKDSSGQPVIGASVVVDGTTLGVSSGIDGDWSIDVPDAAKHTLVISYIGMKTQRIAIGTRTRFDITLEDDATALDDVVVVGYATVKRRDVVGSVASVSSEALTQVPVASVTEAMAGRMAGVAVSSAEGDPDADIKIRVRGGGSITQDNSPLYIVDGFPVESISDIPASDIQSIDVLKDAFSTAIYGSRGANGVVIVTTKSGEAGKINVNYNVYYGIKKFANKGALTPMTPYEYTQYQYEAAMIEDKLSSKYEPYFGGFADMDLYRNVEGIDWLDQTFGRTGTTFDHNISVSGGGEKFKWTAGYSHHNERAIMIGSKYKRNNLNFKANYKPNKHVQFDLSVRYSDTDVNGAGANSYNDSGSTSGNGRVKHAIQYRPFMFTTAVSDEGDETSAGDNVSPLIATADNDSRYSRTNWNANAAFQWEIVDNLKLRVEAGLDDYKQVKDRFYGMTTYLVYSNAALSGPATQYTDYDRNKIRSTNTLSYDFKNVFSNKDHSLNLLVGQEYIITRSNTLTNWAYNFPSFYDSTMAWQMMSSATGSRSIDNFYNPDDRLFSFFGRVNYDYKGKYMVSATMRADGSSKFTEGNQWGYFPSAAASWRISGEEWLKDTDWLDNLKLRYSFGTAGNNNVPSGLMLTEYAGSDNARGWYLFNNYFAVAAVGGESIMANPDLTWETTYSHNLGLDFSFLRNRISGSVEVYQNNTKDLLIKYPVTGSGYGYQYRNLGETRNRGIELSATFVLLEKPKYGITFSANASYNQNRVMDLGGLDYLDCPATNWASSEIGTDYRVRVGGSVGEMYGYVSDGRYEVDDFNYVDGKWVLKEGVVDCSSVIGSTYLRPGALKLKNVDGSEDNKVTIDDRTTIGNAQPKWTGGFTLSAYFYGFDLAANFNWVYGNQIYNANKIEFTTERGSNSKFRNLIDMMATQNRWTNIDWSTGAVITDPEQLAAANAGTTMWSPLMNNCVFSDWAVEDGSFLRLSSLTLGYTLPERWMKKIRVQRLRLYVTGTNLFCWTGYSGFDPEVDSRRQTPLTPGVDYSAYPRSRGVVFGANLSF